MTARPDHVAVPPTGLGSGVLVLHAWWGRNADVEAYADRLGNAGFVALAPDIAGWPAVATISEAEERVEGLDAEAANQAVAGALERLRTHEAVAGPALGVVGFSLGAGFALRAAAEHRDIGAVVCYYGTHPPLDWSRSPAGFLLHLAESDPYEPDEEVNALVGWLRQTGRDLAVHRYAGTGHWFAEHSQPAYDHAAAQLAWERTGEFLRGRLG